MKTKKKKKLNELNIYNYVSTVTNNIPMRQIQLFLTLRFSIDVTYTDGKYLIEN